MKRVLTIAALTAAVSLVLVGGAVAGTQNDAVIALHPVTHLTKGDPGCAGAPTIPCSDYLKTWPLHVSTNLFLVTARAMDASRGIAGMSCGILYNNAHTKLFNPTWSLCADLQFTNAGVNGEWPASGGGNRITWVSTTNCQRTVYGGDGVHAVAGFFYIYAYSADTFAITPNLNLQIPELAVADCSASTTYLPMDGSRSAVCGFGMDGYNPCEAVPVQATTWGKVKSQF